MKTAYLAINYICNENCKYCPCSKQEKTIQNTTSLNELIRSVDVFWEKGVERIVISGGEPTLHPNFAVLVSYIQEKGMSVIVLSNSERFASKQFVSDLVQRIKVDDISVITTIHSQKKEEHEAANQTPGSFDNTILGIQNIISADINVIIKHCVTRDNYQDLSDFYKAMDRLFPETVSFQLCSIDYCGIPEDVMDSEMLSFLEIKPYLEEMFDVHLQSVRNGSKRHLYCINFPLCSCDVCYWDLIKKRWENPYQLYKDPKKESVQAGQNNVGPMAEVCKECIARDICPGTYLSAFHYFGDAIVRPYKR